MKRATICVICLIWTLGCSSDNGGKIPGMDVGNPADASGDTGVLPGETVAGDSPGIPLDLMPEDETAEVEVTPDVVETVEEAEVTGECTGPTDEWLDALCADFCDKLEEFNLNTMFAMPAECPGECRAALDEYPDYLANFICVSKMEQHYFMGNCWWPKPLEPVSGCEEWCDEVIGCGLEDVFGFPGDPCLCEATCTGLFTMAGEAALPLIECASEALAANCDYFDMMECFGFTVECEESCAELEEKCEDGETLEGLYPEEGDCISQCGAYTPQQIFAQDVCVSFAGCDQAQRCAGVPEEIYPGCEEFCTEFNGLCTESVIPGSLCPWACTGAAMAIPGSDPLGAADCVAEQEVCPDESHILLATCLTGPCTLMCYQVGTECEPDAQYYELFPTPEDCEEVCNDFTDSQAGAAGLCMLVAGCDNTQACLDPPEETTAGCDEYCDALLDLCGNIPWWGAKCEDFCTGMSMVWPHIDPGTGDECLAQYDTCPEDLNGALFGCIAGKCGGMCGMFESCEPDSAYYELYESPETCHETCEGLTYSQATMTSFCLGWASCDGADSCTAPPLEAKEGCDVYCDAAQSLCPDGIFGAAACGDACTGLSMAVSVADPGASKPCFETFDQCPDPKEAATYSCLVQASEQCQIICDALDGCDLSIDWVCDVFCATIEEDTPAAFAGLSACVMAAGDCENMKPCVGQ